MGQYTYEYFCILSNKSRVLSPNKGAQNERKGHSVEKTRFLSFFVNRWLTNGYTNAYLLSNGLQNPNLRELRFRRAKGKVSSCER